jgi:excisionase family DNA binding protein
MPDYLTTRELAVRLGCSRQNICRLAKAGRIPFVKDGRNIRGPVAAWERHLARQTATALAAVGHPQVSASQ